MPCVSLDPPTVSSVTDVCGLGLITVCSALSSRLLPIHQVMFAGGREPKVRQTRKYVFPADIEALSEPRISTDCGLTEKHEWRLSRDNSAVWATGLVPILTTFRYSSLGDVSLFYLVIIMPYPLRWGGTLMCRTPWERYPAHGCLYFSEIFNLK